MFVFEFTIRFGREPKDQDPQPSGADSVTERADPYPIGFVPRRGEDDDRAG